MKVRNVVGAIGLILLNVCTVSVHATEEDSTIRPGIGFGIVRLGMNRDQITQTLGKRDGKYSMPGGVNVEYSEWKEPGNNSTCRVFFNSQGKVIQLSAEGSILSTADGISCKSSFDDVNAKYKGLQRFKYHAKDGRIDYYDDVKRGIAFEFAWAEVDGESKKRLYAILVHKPGMRVIADADERPVTR